MNEYVLPFPVMVELLVKLGEPSDCTLCGMAPVLVQVQTTLVPALTVRLEGVNVLLPTTTFAVTTGCSPVAVNVTGDPVSAVDTAVAVLAPVAGPSVNDVLAVPDPSDVLDAGVTEPPPAVTAQLTVTPDTPLPKASLTDTCSGFASAAETGPLWLVPPLSASCG